MSLSLGLVFGSGRGGGGAEEGSEGDRCEVRLEVRRRGGMIEESPTEGEGRGSSQTGEETGNLAVYGGGVVFME